MAATTLNTLNIQNAIRRLEVKLARQNAAADQTRTEISVFQKLLEDTTKAEAKK